VKNNKRLHFEKASKKHIVIIGSSLLVLALVATASFNTIAHNRNASITQVYGAYAKNSLVELQVANWNESSSTSGSRSKRVSVATKLTNLQSSTLQVAPGLQFFVVDASGKAYAYTANYLPIDAFIGGPLLSNQTYTYTLDFDVPNNAQIQKLKFQTDSESQPVFVRL
jgi:hypothetical protein